MTETDTAAGTDMVNHLIPQTASYTWTNQAVSVSVNPLNGNILFAQSGGLIYRQPGGTGTLSTVCTDTRSWQDAVENPYNNDVYAVDNVSVYRQVGGAGPFSPITSGATKPYRIRVNFSNGNVYIVDFATGTTSYVYMQTGGAGAFNVVFSNNSQWGALDIEQSTQNVYIGSFSGGNFYVQLGGSGTFTLVPQITGCTHNWGGIAIDGSNGLLYGTTSTMPGSVWRIRVADGTCTELPGSSRTYGWHGDFFDPTKGSLLACNSGTGSGAIINKLSASTITFPISATSAGTATLTLSSSATGTVIASGTISGTGTMSNTATGTLTATSTATGTTTSTSSTTSTGTATYLGTGTTTGTYTHPTAHVSEEPTVTLTNTVATTSMSLATFSSGLATAVRQMNAGDVATALGFWPSNSTVSGTTGQWGVFTGPNSVGNAPFTPAKPLVFSETTFPNSNVSSSGSVWQSVYATSLSLSESAVVHISGVLTVQGTNGYSCAVNINLDGTVIGPQYPASSGYGAAGTYVVAIPFTASAYKGAGSWGMNVNLYANGGQTCTVNANTSSISIVEYM
jgi:hypothetical protein